MERCKREIEVKKDFMDTVFGVKKTKTFGVVRDGFNNQATIIGWEGNESDVVFAYKLKTRATTVLELQAFYLERELNLGSSITTLHHGTSAFKSVYA